jgi:flagellar hook-associated protein 3 FlgL
MAVTRDATGRVSAIIYAGNSGETEIPLSESSSIKPTTTAETNQGIASFLNQLVALRDALNHGGGPAVATARQGLIESEDGFVDAIAGQGAVQMRLEVNQTLQQSRDENLESLVSAEVDDDMATAIVRLNQSQLAYQAALQSSSNIMKMSLLDYIK